jgi:cytochrome c553
MITIFPALWTIAAAATLLQAPAAAQDAETGRFKSQDCPVCHWTDNYSPTAMLLKVAGQQNDDVLKQRPNFKARRRTNDAGNMTSVSQTLSETDIDNLAHYITGLR